MQTTEPRYKQVTVNLDAITIERCHLLAIARSHFCQRPYEIIGCEWVQGASRRERTTVKLKKGNHPGKRLVPNRL